VPHFAVSSVQVLSGTGCRLLMRNQQRQVTQLERRASRPCLEQEADLQMQQDELCFFGFVTEKCGFDSQ